MASCEVPAKLVLENAKQMIMQLDQEQALKLNEFITKKIKNVRFWTGEKVWKSAEQVIKHFEYEIKELLPVSKQRKKCESIAILCTIALINHVHTVHLTDVDLEDLGVLGDKKFRLAMEWKPPT